MPIKPVGQIKSRKPLNPMPEAVLDRQPSHAKTPKIPASQMGSIVPHSAHAARRSHEYHKTIKATMGLSRPESSTRMTDRLNPNPSIERARTQGRSFPGLAE